MNETELAELQRQIDWRRAEIEHWHKQEDERDEHVTPAAISINNGPLLYGELTVIHPKMASINHGLTPPYLLNPGEWHIQIDFDPDINPELLHLYSKVEIAIGDTLNQPHRGTAWVQNMNGYIGSRNWTVKMQGIGELSGILDTPEQPS